MTQLDHPLVQTLSEVASQDPKRMRAGEERLSEWVKQPGYHLSLLEIGYSNHLPTNIRLTSLLLLKNNIDKYWRKTSSNPISTEEKLVIRQNLLNFFWESQNQLQTQNSVIIGKISRLDFPAEWPNLIPELCQKIQELQTGDNNLETYRKLGRILYTINSVVKALSSKTLALSRRQFEEASPPLLQLISLVYSQNFNQLKGQLEAQQLEGVSELINITHYCLKISRRLLVYGFKLPFNTTICQELVGIYLEHLSLVYNYIKLLPNEYQFIDSLIKLIILIGKIFIELQNHFAIEFVNHSKFLPLMLNYWQILNDLVNNESDQLEKLIIQSLTLYKNTIFNYYYMIGDKETPTQELLQARSKINEELLNDEFLFKVVELVMTRYMTLKPHSDLAQWEEDPQLWLLDEASDPWEFRSRACAEKVIISTVARDKSRIGPFLVQLVQKFSGPASTLEELLIKDSVYNACGLASHELFDYLDFDSWFKDRLIQEIQQQSPGHYVLKFRIAWLIGRWVGVKLPKESRPLVYETLLHLMQPGSDDGPSTIVQITAISALRDCVDDWDFEPDRFLPYLAQVLPLLSQVLVQVDEIELKMKVVNCLSIIVERMEHHIVPFTGAITELLPRLWQLEGEGENLLKSSIVTMVTKLVKSIKSDPLDLLNIIIEIVRHSTNLNNEAHVYLLEDGVDLWLATMINSSTLTPALIDILPCSLPLLSIASEVLAKVLLVVESYLLLDTSKTIEVIGAPLLETLSSSLTEVRPEACTKICRVIETSMILASPPANLQRVFMQSGLLSRLLDLMLNPEEPPSNQTKYLILISRFIIWDSNQFLNFLINIWGQETLNFFENFIKIWFDRVDVTIDTRHRKLNSIALASLLQTSPNTPELTALTNFIYSKLPEFMTVWTSCLAEVEEFPSGDALVYHSEYSSQKVDHLGDFEIDNTREDDRRNQIPETDIVFCTHLKSTIWNSLERAQLHSPQLIQNYLNEVDILIIDQIKP